MRKALILYVNNPFPMTGQNMTASWKSVIEVIDLVTKMVNVQTNMSHTESIKLTSTLNSEIQMMETMVLMIWQ